MGTVFGSQLRLTVPAVDVSVRLKEMTSGGAAQPDQAPRYVKDAFRVYYRGKEVPEADAQSFEELRDGYGKDAFRAFYEGQTVPESSGVGFEVQSGGYAKDAFRSFYRGRPAGAAGGLAW